MNKLKLAWAAGLFDGEGCLSIERMRPRRKSGERSVKYRLRLRVSMTDKKAVHSFRKAVGGGNVCSYFIRKQHRKVFCWSVEGERGAAVIMLLRPYLVVKDKEADLGISFIKFQRKSVPLSIGKNGASAAVLAERAWFYEKMHSLKTRRKQGLATKQDEKFP